MSLPIHPHYTFEDAGVAGCPMTEDTAPEQTVEQVGPVTITISVHFDGTLNNRANTTHRIRGDRFSSSHGGEGTSYSNDYSNTARLSTAQRTTNNEPNDFQINIYVSGIGTTDHSDDDATGTAVGAGTTGVVSKVDQAVNQIVREVRAVCPDTDVPITYIKLDSLGFSRGATAARHFIHKILRTEGESRSLRDRLSAYSIGTIQFRFVGLFDSVSSYHERLSISPDFSNDTNELHLNSVGYGEVIKVVHLAAGDEHRKNFSLTNTNSAAGKGPQIFLPGVHSDIGGGYVDGASENRLILLELEEPPAVFDELPAMRARERREHTRMVTSMRTRLEQERDLLDAQGWYDKNAGELVIDGNKLLGTRDSIGNGYDKIPLHIMADYATQSGLVFNSLPPVPPELATVHSQLSAYCSRNEGGGSQPSDWLLSASPPIPMATLKMLRHNYFHSSAHYTRSYWVIIPNEPRFTTGDPYTGQRRRMIYDG